ncbi:MAG: ABC transporter substrate-binding protein, partial [Planctomycetota bacterium]
MSFFKKFDFRKGNFSNKKILLFLLSFGLFYFLWSHFAPVDKYYIGMAVPLSGDYKDRGICYVRAVQIYCKQINDQGGIHGVPLEIVVRDDENDPETAEKIAQRFSEDPEILGVIGHHYSPSAISASKIYEKEGLVLLSPYVGNPTFTQNSKWSFSMMKNDIEEGKFIAVYMKTILKLDNILLLYAEDQDFGSNLNTGFSEKASKIGLTIVDTQKFDPMTIEDNFIATRISEEIKQKVGGVAIFSHSSAGIKMVEQVRKRGIHAQIIGPHSFSSSKFIDLNEKYTTGVYVVSPFLYELGNEVTKNFVKEYQKEFSEFPNNHAPLAYDAAHFLVQAIQNKGRDRTAIRDYIENINYENSLEGASGGILYFGKNHNMDRDFIVSEIKDGRFKIAYTQLKEPKEPYILKQLEERVKKGSLILIDEVPYHVVDLVFIGIDFLKINDISTTEMNFNAEIFMWFKWSNPKIDPNDFYFLNGISNPINKIEMLKENLSKTIKYRCYRLIWNYSTDFNLREFPFDHQMLNITVSHKNLNSGHLLLALDSRHMTKEPVTNIPEEWEYLVKEMNSGLYRYDSTFGDPDYRMGTGYKSKIYFATTEVDIELKRRVTSYIFTFFAPLGIIVIITILIFGIPIEDLAT